MTKFHELKDNIGIIKTMNRFCVILLLILLSCNNVSACWISGKVIRYNYDSPAKGVAVTIKETLKGTTTDIDGNYRIEADSSNTTIVFSYRDYEPQEINIGNDSIINVVLMESDIQLVGFFVHATVFFETKETWIRDTIRIKKFRIHKFKISRFEEHIRIYPKIEEERWHLIKVEKHWDGRESPNIFKYIFDSINYPEVSACNGIEGNVYVRFKIDLDGNLEIIKIIRGFDERINKEIFSAFRSAPKLTDYELKQIKRGNPKYYTGIFLLPIKFRITRVDKLE